MSLYIIQLGWLVIDKDDSSSKLIDQFNTLIYADISDNDEEKEKVNTQTKKSISLKFQKDKYKRLAQGICKGRLSIWKRKPSFNCIDGPRRGK